ncbi:SGNH/GDSL hydrolase family protein [Mucilaginibacter sp. AW1-3]
MKIRIVFALLSIIPVMLKAQGVPMSDKKLNIFTLGDSNGTFAWSWPVQIRQALPNATVFNISKSGRTVGFLNNGDSTLNSLSVIDENLKKAAENTKDKPYDYIVMELGTNDCKKVFADRQNEVPANLEKLINKLKHSPYPSINKARIIIIAPPPYGSKTVGTEKYDGGIKRVEALSKEFEKVAKKTGCIFVDGFKTPGLDMETMSTDGLHMDVIGSRKLIEPVVKAMIR